MIHTISNGFLKVDINTLGAELNSVVNIKSGHENLWQGDPAVWTGHAPILFPIVGRLKKDQYEYDGVIYPLPQHGFARRREFDVVAKTDAKLVFELRDDEKTREAYPFGFRLWVQYTLEENSLRICYGVENTDSKRIWFSIGAHPGFTCVPGDRIVFNRKETMASLRLEEGTHLVTDRLLPVFDDEDTIVLDEHTFDDDSLIFRDFKSDAVTLMRQDGSFVKVDLGKSTCMALWSKPKMGLRYVCIEPWLGVDDYREVSGRIEEKPLVESLGAGETLKFEIAFTIG